MATAEVMRRYRAKHHEKTNAYNRTYMRKFMFDKRQKSRGYDTYSRMLRKIDITIFIY